MDVKTWKDNSTISVVVDPGKRAYSGYISTQGYQ